MKSTGSSLRDVIYEGRRMGLTWLPSSQLESPLLVGIDNQHRAIQCKFQPVDLTLLKNLLGAWWGLLPTLRWVGSWLPTYLVSFFFQLGREKISQRELNCQPLHLEMGTSPLSPGSLGSSHASSFRIGSIRLLQVD